MNGIKDVRLNYAFLDNLTASAINVSGFFNFTDIDLLQSIDLFNNNNIQNYYVTKGNELYYKVHNGYIKIGEVNQKNTSPENMNHWLTYTYQGVSNFDVRYNQDYETGAVFTYTYQAPVVIEEKPAEPEAIPVKPAQESPKEEIKAEESTEVKTDVKSEVKAEPKELNITAKLEKKAVIETKVAKAKPLKQEVLPQTNMQSSSLLTILGGACVFLLSAIFLNKKKI
ncbi:MULTISPECIES: LPXTG cell wall anchor domain-containing protein [Enterococcus]|uniref:LPXTG cell wall anchor domain-containing protein n=1 Tax=Enterococcus TaxID=1350 RepID=UPI003565114D